MYPHSHPALRPLCLVMIFTPLVLGEREAAEAGSERAATLGRQWDVAVVTGDKLDAFTGKPIGYGSDGSYQGELFLYSYRGGQMTQIPFQLDEKTTLGEWVNRTYPGGTDNVAGLDPNDELAFLTRDVGDKAPAGTYPDEPGTTYSSSIEIEVADAGDPDQKGWVYLIRSRNASYTAGDLITHTGPTNFSTSAPQVRAAGYDIGFNAQAQHADSLYDYLVIKDGAAHSEQLLDKLKVKGEAKVYIGFGWLRTTFNENLPEINITLDGVIDGTVRVIETTTRQIRLELLGVELLNTTVTGTAYFHPWSVSFPLPIDPAELANSLPDGFKEIRVAATIDFNENAIGSVFANENASNVVIDGNPDDVPATMSGWAQVIGTAGRMFIMGNYSVFEGLSWCYRDDSTGTVAPCIEGVEDTGDGVYIGDTGIHIDVDALIANPPSTPTSLTMALYFLPPSASDTGTSLYAKQESGLTITAAALPGVPVAGVYGALILMAGFLYPLTRIRKTKR
ncbi:MAG: hypothetical protein HYV63_22880 [Candidatus Schekmanbacteria bacterium]|nr:hypothetical protein [Candidatus Schekmanbacteria bacterium]